MYAQDITLTSNNNSYNGISVAPFVLKTYEMVTEPTTNHLITWSRGNNSFIVVDSLEFARGILPSHFKHNNFSSFIRQLNTYGFKKVDPDKWEFANEWFLRGQRHLLKNIRRRRNNADDCHQQAPLVGEEEAGEVGAEIARMRREQREMEEELRGMTRRLEATERRPEQMVAFLSRVVEDPEILKRLAIERSWGRSLSGGGGEKRRRVSATEEEEERSSSQWAVSSSGKECSPPGWYGGRGIEGVVSMYESGGRAVAPVAEAGFEGGHVVGFGVEEVEERRPPPYPFSLFSGGI